MPVFRTLRPLIPALLLAGLAVPAGARDLGHIDARIGEEAHSTRVLGDSTVFPGGAIAFFGADGVRAEAGVDALGVPDAGDAGPGAIILGVMFATPDAGTHADLTADMLVDFYVMVAETWAPDAEEPSHGWLSATEDGGRMRITDLTLTEDAIAVSGTLEDARFCLVPVDAIDAIEEDRSGADCRTGSLRFDIDTR